MLHIQRDGKRGFFPACKNEKKPYWETQHIFEVKPSGFETAVPVQEIQDGNGQNGGEDRYERGRTRVDSLTKW